VKSANTLLLVMKGTDMRLDASLQQMLREMEALFGEDMWNHVVVGVSFWSFDEYVVQDRNRYKLSNGYSIFGSAGFMSVLKNI
jgi:hypothetical protein